ncbi:uncharacterized protein N7469_011086 [Penicillium citrinum]|uniref:Uncharacterized protein n=1 Tax=Penicillium citrinum TaxID=5077 RepID=A0A9W9TCH0_PENCI|nr:uncharacterized protein N7469_011086 [Penicillium citrinum]KAJ5217461.1 hypothetical protein N7469_011086 [Penicillium citrinum]
MARDVKNGENREPMPNASRAGNVFVKEEANDSSHERRTKNHQWKDEVQKYGGHTAHQGTKPSKESWGGDSHPEHVAFNLVLDIDTCHF